MHGDEPDNAQSRGKGKGYGPPILPATIIEDYRRTKKADPSRPVLLNLGQGVAWDRYQGRGTRTNHPEDYAEYIKGRDIVSFDIWFACCAPLRCSPRYACVTVTHSLATTSRVFMQQRIEIVRSEP
jgi:hypothetical protein